MNTKIKKIIINTIIFLSFVGGTFYIIFKDNNISEIIEIVRQVDKRFIALGVLFMSFFIIAEGINISRTLKLLNSKISVIKGIKYALVRLFL